MSTGEQLAVLEMLASLLCGCDTLDDLGVAIDAQFNRLVSDLPEADAGCDHAFIVLHDGLPHCSICGGCVTVPDQPG